MRHSYFYFRISLPLLVVSFFIIVFCNISITQAVESSTTLPASSPLQKAFENVKDGLDTLVSAKDTQTQDNLGLRIDIFDKILSFSITEAKDLKLKLLALDNLDASSSLWRDVIVEKITQSLEWYATQKNVFDDTRTTITLLQLKTISDDFRAWRETTFLPLANEIQDFLLIDQESHALQISTKRFEKINEDVKKLEKAKIKGTPELQKLLVKAGKLLNEAKSLNTLAMTYFKTTHFSPVITLLTSSDTSPLASSITTSTEEKNTENKAQKDTIVRDTVTQSLNKIRETYQVFLEMSTLVKKIIK